MKTCAFRILEYLSRFQEKDGGLNDPDLKRPVPNSYGNVFYALGCAKLFHLNGEMAWKSRALGAWKSEMKSVRSYHSYEGIFRFEFKNYALIRIYLSLGDDVADNDEKIQIENYLKSWHNVCSYQTNYSAMRALNSLLRFNVFGESKDRWRARLEMGLVMWRQDDDGFFRDDVKHNSFQYHAYVLALIYQYYLLSGEEKIKKRFLRGVNFLVPFVDGEGDFNYFGRGQRQIFGYISYIYALMGAAKLTENKNYLELAGKILSFIEPYLSKYEIVCAPNPEKKIGYYSYNNRSDYLAFAAYYLLLSDEILEKIKSNAASEAESKSGQWRGGGCGDEGIFEENEAECRYYATPNLLLIKDNKSLYVLGGTPGNHAEKPLIIHSYPPVLATSGGPVSAAGSEIQYGQAYSGFVSDGGELAVESEGGSDSSSIKMIHKTRNNIVCYCVVFSDKIGLDITITPKKANRVRLWHMATRPENVEKFYCSLPLEKRGQIYCLDGRVEIYESAEQFIDKKVTFKVLWGSLEGKCKAAKIKKKSISREMTDRWGRYPYFAGILALKAIRNPRQVQVMLKNYKERKKYY